MAVASPVRVDVERFEEEGYLVAEGLLDPAQDLDPVIDEYMALLDTLTAQWLAEGKITSTHADLPFAQRMAQVLSETSSAGYRPFDISLPFSGVTEETPIHLGPAVFQLLTSPRLIDAVEQLIGSEILSNPIQHVRIKPPQALLPPEFQSSLVGQTDWHQDQGVALPEVDETTMLTVWLPITDATEENGCLCVVPYSHQRGLVTHCPGRGQRKGLHIPDEVRGRAYTPVPIKRGGALFLHCRTMHASLKNESDGVRWSFDLRYQPIGQPTGRPWFPAFVVRSRHNPVSEVTDWRVWADLWRQTRTRLAAEPPAGKFNRWTGEEAVCEVA
ncbi:MAG: phytanoyl-CoA dioxygenase family protein [Chloroflexi bacterium]|nr:phytanoyl-CoA dioxygenase family protein [Chloroflexota bacterium]